ncbi:ATP synthase membrane subunit ea isoform X1 [Pangasianodon hypophthalmus]|uniref:ATP synthase membrane subunit ea isoform X1 n=1 Tax=Pangasianodon hypophthalmus TaxID=310915 RepID=UPI002308029F|nr:ATP synthase membrane subunit ea isoform X1 [Pangasianodon hypophthalmus]
MVPPVQVSPLIKTARWSALLVGMIYGKQRYDYLKPIAAEERQVEGEEKKQREEQERIYKQLAEERNKAKHKLFCPEEFSGSENIKLQPYLSDCYEALTLETTSVNVK